MNELWRMYAYHAQNGAPRLTARQLQRYRHKWNRSEHSDMRTLPGWL